MFFVKEEIRGIIFDIKRYAIHDGPGIRTTLFLKGCPARCLWCANPESQSFAPELIFRESECIDCGKCLSACPQGALSVVAGHRTIDRRACKNCGKCAAVCPAQALEMVGREVTAESLYEEIASDRIFWERSRGGITLSGGEPLAQANFARAFLEICKARHVHTALETCLYAPKEALESLVPFVDLFICDMKIMENEKHRQYTGVSNEVIKKNLEYLLASSREVLVRMPLIPGINDDEKNLTEMAHFLKSHGRETKIEILPYHSFGEPKYAQLGRQYEMSEISPPSKDALEEALRFLSAQGLEITKS